MPAIHCILTASIRTEGDPKTKDPLRREWTTGFYKEPITGPAQVSELGIVGDAVADTKHHGGTDKAILCYSLAHYEAWQDEHPELGIGPGGFAENLTVTELTEADVCIGDVFVVGECRFQVSQPRQPCWKISRRWGVKSLTKEVVNSGRTGWYLRVLENGSIQTGDQVKLVDRSHPNWSIKRANDILFKRERDPRAASELHELPELASAWKASL